MDTVKFYFYSGLWTDQVGADMRFSIIIATINRTEENLRLLKSIAAQQYNDIEVIFADQNNDDRLNPILAQYRLLFPSNCSRPS